MQWHVMVVFSQQMLIVKSSAANSRQNYNTLYCTQTGSIILAHNLKPTTVAGATLTHEKYP